MRAAAHAVIGGASSMMAVLAIRARFPDARLPDPVFAAVVGAIAAGLPDMLEPAIKPSHRQVCHSLAFASLMSVALKQIYDWAPQTEEKKVVRDILLCVGIGYLSHLGADATTPAGLPWIGSFS